MSLNIDPSHQINKDDQVKVDFYSELMKNYFPESAIKAGQEIQTLMVDTERPMIFCLDAEEKLQAILRTEGSESGWLKIPLSKGKVASFDIEYDARGKSFRIAKVEDNKAWVSREMRLSRTRFERLERSIKWDSWSPEGASEKIHKIYLGMRHMLYATATTGKDALYYLADLETDKQVPYTLPENATDIRQLELGNFYNTHGIFLLYGVGTNTTMLYQSLPLPEFPRQSTQARFSSGELLNCFTLLEGDRGQDMLYIGGEKVAEFIGHSNGQSFSFTNIPTVSGGAIKKLKAAGNGKERSVWSLNDKGLHYCTNRYFDQSNQSFETGSWTKPLLMDEHAEQFSCLKGPDVQNQVFSISTQGGSELTRLWQDSTTTLWNQHKLTIQDLDALKEVESYSAHIRFSAATNVRTFHGLKVKVQADSNLFVYINGRSYHIGPDRTAEIELSITAELTVVCPVEDISAARLFLSADFLDGDIAINLTDKVLERLEEKIPNADALASASRPDGSSLVPAGTDSKIIKGAAQGLHNMLGAAKELQTPSPGSFQKTEFTLGNSAGVTAAMPMSGGHTLGDFLHSVWEGAKEAVSFVIEKIKDGFRFIIKIGEQIFDWIVNTVREIGSFIQKIFEAIAVAFKDLFEFLAFLFDWQSILDTKDAFVDYTNEAIKSMRDSVQDIRTFLNKELEKAIDNFSPELNNLPGDLKNLDVGEGESQESEADPRANWLNSKKDAIQNGKEGISEAMPKEFGDVFAKFIKEAEPIFRQLGEGFMQQVSLIGDAFKKVIQGEMSFGDFLIMLAKKLAGFAIFLVKQLIDLLLASLVALIEVASVGLNHVWNIPIISAIYEDITGKELTFLEVLCLFIAIPTNVIYKIGEGKAPFENQKTREAFVKSGRQVFNLNIA